MPVSRPLSRCARVHPRPCAGCQPVPRSSAASGLVLAIDNLGTITGRGTSNFEDLGLFLLQQLVDRVRVLVGELLHPLLGTVLLVAADLPLVDELLQMVHDVAAHVAHGDSAVLRHLAHDLDELLAPLLGQLGDRQADQLAVVRRGQAQVRLLDRALDRRDRVRIERLDREQAWLRRVHRRQLLEGRLLTVVVDLHAVEQARRGAARTQRRELRLSGLDGLVHPPGCILNQVIDRHLASSRGRDDGADPLSLGDFTDVSVLEGEDIDRQPVVHAEGERGRVHHPWKCGSHIYPIDGAGHDLGADETPWAYRDTRWSQVIIGVEPDPAGAGALRDWTVGYWEAIHPYSAGGAYVNFMMDEGEDRVRATYGKNYARLAKIKKRYDPGNLFRVNQNIKPK